MSRFKFFAAILCFQTFMTCLAQAEESVGSSVTSTKPLVAKTVTLSYLSWSEFVDLDNGALKDNAYANFYGNALSVELESFHGRQGYAVEAALLTGQANAGGTQSVITYQTSSQKWWGAMATARYAFRLSPQITMSAGPLILSRQMNWPSEGTNANPKSGAPINYGALADLRLRLAEKWEVRQAIGTLALKASTIWSLGIGYKF